MVTDMRLLNKTEIEITQTIYFSRKMQPLKKLKTADLETYLDLYQNFRYNLKLVLFLPVCHAEIRTNYVRNRNVRTIQDPTVEQSYDHDDGNCNLKSLSFCLIDCLVVRLTLITMKTT